MVARGRGDPERAPGSPEVHRVEGGWLSRLRTRAAPAMTGPSGRSGGRRFLRAVYDRTLRKVHWPDYAFAWRRPATRRAVQLQRAEPFDALITVSPPFTANQVGMALRRRFPDLLWLVDLGDPFSFEEISPPNNPVLYRRKNRRFEEKVLRSADLLATVNAALRDLWVRHFPETSDKFHVVPPLALAGQPDPAPFLPSTGARKMVFAGNMYKSAGPAPLFRLIERVNEESGHDWELHILGDPWEVRAEVDAYHHLLGTRVHLHGKVPRAQAERALLEADVLVSIGMRSNVATPSKLFHYFGTGKPVVHVPYMWPDALAPFLARYPRSHVITASDAMGVGPLPAALLRLLEDTDTPPQVPRWLDDHSPTSLATQYVGLLARARKERASTRGGGAPPARPVGSAVLPGKR